MFHLKRPFSQVMETLPELSMGNRKRTSGERCISGGLMAVARAVTTQGCIASKFRLYISWHQSFWKPSRSVCPMMSRMSSDERIADVSAALKVCTVVVRYLVLVSTPLRTAEACM